MKKIIYLVGNKKFKQEPFEPFSYEVCEFLGVNYSNVKNTIVKRNHINDSYLDCNKKKFNPIWKRQ